MEVHDFREVNFPEPKQPFGKYAPGDKEFTTARNDGVDRASPVHGEWRKYALVCAHLHDVNVEVFAD